MEKKGKTKSMKKVGIVGVGRVGSAIASMMLFHPKVETIVLNDIDIPRCLAEKEDLVHAMWILGQQKMIITGSLDEVGQCDYIFICAGKSRENSSQRLSSLYKWNIEIVTKIVASLPLEKVYIVTNPSVEIAVNLGVNSIGSALDRVRKNMGGMSGGWILDRKGYTNWGVASEAYKTVK